MVRNVPPEAIENYGHLNAYNPPAVVVGASGEAVGGQQWASEIKAVFDCDFFASQTPSGTTLEFDVGSSATATVDTVQIVTGTPSPPPPTTQTIFGSTPPLLTSISPTSGPAGSTVTLTGTNLTAFTVSFGGTPGHASTIGPSGGSKVSFNDVPAANVTCSSATSCTATVPATAAAGNQFQVTLTNSAGTSNALTFTITAAPASSPGL